MLYTYKAKCCNVINGDTFDFIIDLGFNLTLKLRARLSGINTPELRGATDQERKHAREVKTFVETLILDKEVTIRTSKGVGVYGHYLVEVFLPDEENLTEKLIEADFSKREDYLEAK